MPYPHGTYDQTATYSTSVTTSVYAQAKFYSVSVTHN
jgi:hypothetical protein